MDKKALVHLLVESVAKDHATLIASAVAAHEAATHSESKAEDQYDTRGLEASYLAGAQSRRAMELEEVLALFRNLDLQTFTDQTPIASTALVELENDGKKTLYFMMPKGGGMTVTHAGNSVQVVTPISPLGEALLGRRVGDQIELRINRVVRDYEITAVW